VNKIVEFFKKLFGSKPKPPVVVVPPVTKVQPPYPSSAVVWSSDYSTGLAEGVIVPSAKNNKFVTARHYNTPIGTKVHLKLDDGTKFETKVVAKVLPDIKIGAIALAPKPEDDRYWYGDVAICEVETPFPVTPPEIKDISAGAIVVQHRDKVWKKHVVGYDSKWNQPDTALWLRTYNGSEIFKSGDSGLPWFFLDKLTNKWTTVGITSRAAIEGTLPWSAEAPRLGSKKIKGIIESYTK
jgi:hypothetical protein